MPAPPPPTRTLAATLIAACVITLALSFASTTSAETEATPSASAEDAQASKRAAVKDVLKRYALARYSADVEGAKACAHPEISRRSLMHQYWGSASPDWVRTLSRDMFAFLDTGYVHIRRVEPETGRADAVVFDVAGFSASAMLVMEDSIELVHVIEFDGEWVIADSSVQHLEAHTGAVPAPADEKDRAAIEATCRDYCMGFYEIDATKVQGTCHPTLSKRTKRRTHDTHFDWMQEITWDEIWLLAKSFNREMGFDPETARCDIEIYYADEEHATAKLTGASWFDYFQLMKVNEEWQIVNIFYEALPREQWSERPEDDEDS